MLRKLVSPEPVAPSSGKQRRNPDRKEDGEKGSKIRRRQHSQFHRILLFLGLGLMLSLVVMVKFRHKNKYTPSKLRSSSRSLNQRESHESSVELMDAGSFLPPNSIYKLSVEDNLGKMLSLEKYHGMVTLIVNVACL
jgi:hypothetical protein